MRKVLHLPRRLYEEGAAPPNARVRKVHCLAPCQQPSLHRCFGPHPILRAVRARLPAIPQTRPLLAHPHLLYPNSKVMRLIIGTHPLRPVMARRSTHAKVSALLAGWTVLSEYNVSTYFGCVERFLRGCRSDPAARFDWAEMQRRECYHDSPQGRVAVYDGELILDNPRFVDHARSFSTGDGLRGHDLTAEALSRRRADVDRHVIRRPATRAALPDTRSTEHQRQREGEARAQAQ